MVEHRRHSSVVVGFVLAVVLGVVVVAQSQQPRPASTASDARPIHLEIGPSLGLMWFDISNPLATPAVVYGGTLNLPVWRNFSLCLEGDSGTRYVFGVPIASLLLLECAVVYDLAPRAFASPFLLVGGGYRRFDFGPIPPGEGFFVTGGLGLRARPVPYLALTVQVEVRAEAVSESPRVLLRSGISLRL